jgi:hypothetical protein
MALTRKMLRAMGIEDDKADEIIEAHAETVDALKAKAQEAGDGAGKAEELAKQVEQLKKELEEAQKAGDPDGLKAKYDKEHEAFEAYKADVSAKEADRTKRSLYRKFLTDAGVDPKRVDAVLRVSDLSKVEVKDGAIQGADELEKGIKSDWADFIPTTSTQGAEPATPPKVGAEPEPDYSKMTATEYINWKHSQGK